MPAEFAHLIMQLMAKDPADRPQSAEEVGRLLAAWADPIRPDPVGVSVAVRRGGAARRVELGGDSGRRERPTTKA